MAEPELEPGELAELVDDRVRDPPPPARLPEPAELLARVAAPGPPQRHPRLVALDIRVLRRDSGVEESPERRRDRVRVRVTDDGIRLVHEREPVPEDATRPLLVLAHRQVLAEGISLEDRPGNRGIDVREQRGVVGQLLTRREALDAAVSPVQEIEEEHFRRSGIRVGELAAVRPRHVGACPGGGPQPFEPAIVVRDGIL